MNKILLITALSVLITGCKSYQMPSLFGKGPKELPRYGTEATHYQCASAQSFGLMLSEKGEEAWLMLPDHEIGLNRDENDKSLYHYGTVYLHLDGDNTSLDDGEHLHYKACKTLITPR